MGSYTVEFSGAPNTWLEDFDGWRIIYADDGLSRLAYIAPDGAGLNALGTGSLGAWVIYAPSSGSSPTTGNHRVSISGISYSPQIPHAIIRATAGGKDGFAIRVTTTTSVNIYRSSAGALTSLGTIPISPDLAFDDVFEFYADGNTLGLKRNGVQIWSYASATQYQSNTDVGIPIRGTASLAGIIHSWSSEDIGGGGSIVETSASMSGASSAVAGIVARSVASAPFSGTSAAAASATARLGFELDFAGSSGMFVGASARARASTAINGGSAMSVSVGGASVVSSAMLGSSAMSAGAIARAAVSAHMAGGSSAEARADRRASFSAAMSGFASTAATPRIRALFGGTVAGASSATTSAIWRWRVSGTMAGTSEMTAHDILPPIETLPPPSRIHTVEHRDRLYLADDRGTRVHVVEGRTRVYVLGSE